MSGKGSRPRPLSVDHSTFDSNWDRIFGKKHNLVQQEIESLQRMSNRTREDQDQSQAWLQNEYYDLDSTNSVQSDTGQQ
jgi:hypothetical protein